MGVGQAREGQAGQLPGARRPFAADDNGVDDRAPHPQGDPGNGRRTTEPGVVAVVINRGCSGADRSLVAFWVRTDRLTTSAHASGPVTFSTASTS